MDARYGLPKNVFFGLPSGVKRKVGYLLTAFEPRMGWEEILRKD
jgi:hypothetical protein